MPTLDFKGKQFVYSHHHSVPFRELVVEDQKSLPKKNKKPSLDDNLIINDDNLHALKALMPLYAGKVKCIYIDPPYNTGNEGWCYNDNVNSPLMKEWLLKNANPVDKEDLQRHDKWLCMMYPRLKLLHELLADDGVIFVSIDDNEVHHLRAIMDEIFGEENFVSELVWKSRQNKDNRNKTGVSNDHEYILSYSKFPNYKIFRGEERDLSQYNNPDNDPRGDWTSSNMVGLLPENLRPNCHYNIVNPVTGISYDKPEMGWRYDKNTMQKLISEDKILWPKQLGGRPRRKMFLFELKEETTGFSSEVKNNITTQTGTKELNDIIESNNFSFPKPSQLLKIFINQSTDKNSIILDSFAGSGTTAHAVLDLNKEDGGNRKFILVEMEDYADKITAERVRRVINGVPNAKDEKLKQGLGGSFTFCKLGDEFNIEKILTGENLPKYESLANYVFYTATGKSLETPAKQRLDYFVGETDLYEVYLIYQADITFLRSNESALNSKIVEIISNRDGKKQKLVFASSKYMGQNELNDHNIIFCQLPYAIHKITAK